MKQKRSINEALSNAKKMRQALAETAQATPQTETRLKVVEQPQAGVDKQEEKPTANAEATGEIDATSPSAPPKFQQRETWVRHTVGLRDSTRLKLRDAADAQKKKDRYGTLLSGEPRNEQEIADLGILLALQQLGCA